MADFSIIIPVYNGEKTIRNAIDSCIKQTFKNFEIIIVNNGSTDMTSKIVSSYSDERIKYFYIEEKGRSKARNFGLLKSKGKYIQFLDADDEIDCDKLMHAFNILSINENVDAIQCSSLYIKDSEIAYKYLPYSNNDFYYHLFLHNTIPINSMIISKNICKKFPIGYEYMEDWYFWLDSLEGAQVHFDKDYFGAIINIHDDNTSSDSDNMSIHFLLVQLIFSNKKISKKYKIKRNLRMYKAYIRYLNSDIFNSEINELVSRHKTLLILKKINNYKLIKSIFERFLESPKYTSLYD